MITGMFASDVESIVSSDRILYTPSPFARASLLYLQEIGSLQALKPHTSCRANLSSFLFFIVADGKGFLVYNGKRYNLSPGACVFIDCNNQYSHTTDSSLWSLRWCHFNGPLLPQIYHKYVERGGNPVFYPKANTLKSLNATLDCLYKLAETNDYIRDMKINTELNALVTLIMSESWHPDVVEKKTLKENSINSIKNFLDQNYNSDISLDDLSKKFFVNKFYMSRIFKEQVGMTINEYLNNVRVTKAKQMLRFSDKTIADIGASVGIKDPAYFSRLFKKIEGISPDQYRKHW